MTNERKEGTMKQLMSYAAPEAGTLGVSMVMLGAYSYVTLQIPKGLGMLIDLGGKGSPESIKTHCQKLLGLFALGGVANFGRQYLAGRASERIVARLRRNLFSKLMGRGMAFYDDEANRTAELLARLTTDTEKIGKSLTESLLQGLKNIAQTIGALAVMFKISPKLATLLFMMLPPVAFSAGTYGRLARRIEREAGDELALKSVIAEEFLSNIRLVIAFGQQQAAEEQYFAALDSVTDIANRGTLASASYQSFLQTSGYVVVLTLLWAGGIQVSQNKLTVGSLTSLLIYTMFGGVGILGVGNFVADLMKSMGTAGRMFHLLDLPQEELASDRSICETHMLPESAVGGDLKVENVVFRYPSRQGTVWRDVSFSIPSGSCCAVVGHSGAGKTTLVNLLLKLYTPESGSIKLEGVDLANITNAQIRKLVAYVPQDPLLFGGTVLYNILFGVVVPPGVDPMDLAMSAARRARAHDFIQALKDGYGTFVGEKGSQLSGGQRQRIAIARALAKDMAGNSRLLIFDEATTGLDPVNKKALQETIRSIIMDVREGDESSRRTVIALTHDEELLKCCNHVVAFQGGQVAYNGPYKSTVDLTQYTVDLPDMDDKGKEGVRLTACN
eukprot:TRINITY_DN22741_c0_g1_i1.p1 TRINITY_DN22741_c0_g1~~TRINITY_DN22741_c0_g1_i1.p1  ORF type:complete len:615 (+),score=177.74 TRINITY_DN22741_c0_g1_i1:133-1977(+)